MRYEERKKRGLPTPPTLDTKACLGVRRTCMLETCVRGQTVKKIKNCILRAAQLGTHMSVLHPVFVFRLCGLSFVSGSCGCCGQVERLQGSVMFILGMLDGVASISPFSSGD